MRNLMWALMVVAACEGHNDSSTAKAEPTPEPRIIHVPHEQGGSVLTSAQFFGEVHQNDKPGFRVEQAGDTITFRTSRTTCDKMEPIMKTGIPNGATVQCIDGANTVWVMDR